MTCSRPEWQSLYHHRQYHHQSKKHLYNDLRADRVLLIQRRLCTTPGTDPIWYDLSPFGPTRSAVFIAAYYNLDAMIFVLHEGKCDVNRVEGRFGESPLWMAVYWKQYEAARALLLCGADVESCPTQGDFKGTTAFQIAISTSKDRQMATLLRQFGAKHTFEDGCPLRTSMDGFTCSNDTPYCEESNAPSNRSEGTRPWWPHHTWYPTKCDPSIHSVKACKDSGKTPRRAPRPASR